MRMGEEPGCKTSILEHGVIKFPIVFFLMAEGVCIRWSGFAVLLGRGWTRNSEIGVFCWRGYVGFSLGFCCAQAPRGWKSKRNAFVFEVQVGVIVCENHCSDCHESCHTCSAMYDMRAASVALHNIDYDKRGDRYKNMTVLHGFEHTACRK